MIEDVRQVGLGDISTEGQVSFKTGRVLYPPHQNSVVNIITE